MASRDTRFPLDPVRVPDATTVCDRLNFVTMKNRSPSYVNPAGQTLGGRGLASLAPVDSHEWLARLGLSCAQFVANYQGDRRLVSATIQGIYVREIEAYFRRRATPFVSPLSDRYRQEGASVYVGPLSPSDIAAGSPFPLYTGKYALPLQDVAAPAASLTRPPPGFIRGDEGQRIADAIYGHCMAQLGRLPGAAKQTIGYANYKPAGQAAASSDAPSVGAMLLSVALSAALVGGASYVGAYYGAKKAR